MNVEDDVEDDIDKHVFNWLNEYQFVFRSVPIPQQHQVSDMDHFALAFIVETRFNHFDDGFVQLGQIFWFDGLLHQFNQMAATWIPWMKAIEIGMCENQMTIYLSTGFTFEID